MSTTAPDQSEQSAAEAPSQHNPHHQKQQQQLREVMIVMRHGKVIQPDKGAHPQHQTAKGAVTDWVTSELLPCLEQVLPSLGSAQEAAKIDVRVVCSPFPVAYDTAEFVAAELKVQMQRLCFRGQPGPVVTSNVKTTGIIDFVDNKLCDVFGPEGLGDYSEQGVNALKHELNKNCSKVNKRVPKSERHDRRPEWGEKPAAAAERFTEATVGQLRAAANADAEDDKAQNKFLVTIVVAHAATVVAASNALLKDTMTYCGELGFVTLVRDGLGHVRRLDDLCRGVALSEVTDPAFATAMNDQDFVRQLHRDASAVDEGAAVATFAGADALGAGEDMGDAGAHGGDDPADSSTADDNSRGDTTGGDAAAGTAIAPPTATTTTSAAVPRRQPVDPPKLPNLADSLHSFFDATDPKTRNAVAGVCAAIAVVVVAWLLFGGSTASLIDAPADNVRHLSDDLDGVVDRVVRRVQGDATAESVLRRILGGLLH